MCGKETPEADHSRPAASKIRVRVRLFASLADIAGCRELDIDLPAGASVASLYERLQLTYPNFRPYTQRLMFAVNYDYAGQDRQLQPGDEVGIFPPVSGGCGRHG
ncbi:MAG: molybdopterin converting factor subunit 1 [Acidobacteriota bacterium]